MRTIRNANEALMEALVMLDVVERGGSYAAEDWYARTNKLRTFLTEECKRDLQTHVAFDLGECKARVKK